MPNNKIFINSTLRYSKYNFLVGLGFEESRTNDTSYSYNNFSYAYVSNIEDWSGKVDIDWMPNPEHLVKFGVGNIYHTFTPGVNTLQFQTQQTGNIPSNIDTSYGGQIHYAHEISSYVEDEWTANNRLKGKCRTTF